MRAPLLFAVALLCGVPLLAGCDGSGEDACGLAAQVLDPDGAVLAPTAGGLAPAVTLPAAPQGTTTETRLTFVNSGASYLPVALAVVGTGWTVSPETLTVAPGDTASATVEAVVQGEGPRTDGVLTATWRKATCAPLIVRLSAPGTASPGCEDANPCTDDYFDPAAGACAHSPREGSCELACLTGGTCQDGVCTGLVPGCDDGVACTVDTCDAEAGCVHTPEASLCDDGVACTVEACDAEAGCVITPDDAACDDGVACTVDVCDPEGGCASAPDDYACDDGDPCTEDWCDPGLGCDSGVLADGTVCGAGETCVSQALCVDGVCEAMAVAEGDACDDGDPCTQGDVCTDGACTGAPTQGTPELLGWDGPVGGRWVTGYQPTGSREARWAVLRDGRIVVADPGGLFTLLAPADGRVEVVARHTRLDAGWVIGLTELDAGHLLVATLADAPFPEFTLILYRLGSDHNLEELSRLGGLVLQNTATHGGPLEFPMAPMSGSGAGAALFQQYVVRVGDSGLEAVHAADFVPQIGFAAEARVHAVDAARSRVLACRTERDGTDWERVCGWVPLEGGDFQAVPGLEEPDWAEVEGDRMLLTGPGWSLWDLASDRPLIVQSATPRGATLTDRGVFIARQDPQGWAVDWWVASAVAPAGHRVMSLPVSTGAGLDGAGRWLYAPYARPFGFELGAEVTPLSGPAVGSVGMPGWMPGGLMDVGMPARLWSLGGAVPTPRSLDETLGTVLLPPPGGGWSGLVARAHPGDPQWSTAGDGRSVVNQLTRWDAASRPVTLWPSDGVGRDLVLTGPDGLYVRVRREGGSEPALVVERMDPASWSVQEERWAASPAARWRLTDLPVTARAFPGPITAALDPAAVRLAVGLADLDNPVAGTAGLLVLDLYTGEVIAQSARESVPVSLSFADDALLSAEGSATFAYGLDATIDHISRLELSEGVFVPTEERVFDGAWALQQILAFDGHRAWLSAAPRDGSCPNARLCGDGAVLMLDLDTPGSVPTAVPLPQVPHSLVFDGSRALVAGPTTLSVVSPACD